jgi:hypothetical protein
MNQIALVNNSTMMHIANWTQNYMCTHIAYTCAHNWKQVKEIKVQHDVHNAHKF